MLRNRSLSKASSKKLHPNSLHYHPPRSLFSTGPNKRRNVDLSFSSNQFMNHNTSASVEPSFTTTSNHSNTNHHNQTKPNNHPQPFNNNQKNFNNNAQTHDLSRSASTSRPSRFSNPFGDDNDNEIFATPNKKFSHHRHSSNNFTKDYSASNHHSSNNFTNVYTASNTNTIYNNNDITSANINNNNNNNHNNNAKINHLHHDTQSKLSHSNSSRMINNSHHNSNNSNNGNNTYTIDNKRHTTKDYFHHDPEPDFKTKQQTLFETNPTRARPSQWKSLRDQKAKNKYITPHSPVPILGDAIFGTHAVHSAIINQKRKLNQLYLLASVYDDVKNSQRSIAFIDHDAAQNGNSNQNNNTNNHNNKNNEDDGDSLIDDSFLVDSTKLTPISTHFNQFNDDDFLDRDDDDDYDEYDNDSINDGNQFVPKTRYVTPHHLESNRETLLTICELAKTIPGLKITPLRRDKLDILSGNRPHNGVVLDAAPIEPIQLDALDNSHFFLEKKFSTELSTSFVNLSPHEQNKLQHQQTKQSNTKSPQSLQHCKPAVYLAVESTFDSNNLGAILRSSSFFGIDALILPHNSSPLSPVVAKVSSGALDSIDIIQCKNLNSFITNSINNSIYQSHERPSYITTKSHIRNVSLTRNFDKLCVIGLGLTNDSNRVHGSNIFKFLEAEIIPQIHNTIDSITEQQQFKTKDPFAILIVAGNEGFGLSNQIASQCHLLLQIPSQQQFPTTFNGISIRPVVDSLNVSNAVSIALNDVISSRSLIM